MDEEGNFGNDAIAYAREFLRVLREHSIYKEDPVPEWKVIDTSDSGGKCICTKKLTRVFYIQNKNTGEILPTGCDCVERFNVEFPLQCTSCDSPLGNKVNRMKNKDFLCPPCKRAQKRAEKEHAEWLERRGQWKLYHKGPWYGKKFKEVAERVNWVEYLLKLSPTTNTIKAFQEYFSKGFDIVEEVEVA